MTRIALVLFSLASVTHVHAEFAGLGFTGFFNGISPDGTYVVGTFKPSSGIRNTTAYRWSVDGGLENMGLLPGSSLGANASYTRAISTNGDTVVGYGRTDSSSGHVAFAWTVIGGYRILPTPLNFSSAEASAISDDGSIIFGKSSQNTGSGLSTEATRWTEFGVETLGKLAGANTSSIADASADGSVAVGKSGNVAFYWQEGVGISAIPASDAIAVSPEGDFVVGTTAYPGAEAYRWSLATGLETLGFLNPCHSSSRATGVSANGTVVVGYSDSVPFIWTEATGMLDLSSVIQMNGGDLFGWSSLHSNSTLTISDDNSIIVGNGIGANGNEVWRAAIARIPKIVRLVLELSTDLRNWEDIPITPELLSPDGQLRVPMVEDSGFLRLRIE